MPADGVGTTFRAAVGTLQTGKYFRQNKYFRQTKDSRSRECPTHVAGTRGTVEKEAVAWMYLLHSCPQAGGVAC